MHYTRFFITGLLFCALALPLHAQKASPHFRITDDAVTAGTLTGAATSFEIFGSATSDNTATKTRGNFFRLRDTGTTIPAAPTLTNDDDYYNKLHITLPTEQYPDDTRFAVAISSDNWHTHTYIGPDGHPGASNATLTLEDFHTPDFWGGTDGMFIIGLAPETSYSVRVAALQSNAPQTLFSPPSGTVRTSVPFVTMQILRNTTDFFILNTSTVAHATQTELRVSTNSDSGYQTYIHGDGNGLRGGLFDQTTGALIPSDDSILSAGIPGYGAQASSPSARINTRYDHTGNVVGKIAITDAPLSSNTVRAKDESTFVNLRVSIDGTTAAGHYTDTIYYTATVNL